MALYRILLVDDDKVILEAMKLALECRFVIVGAASNGREALDILAHSEVDIVVTDVSMPVMNGLELIAEIRNRYKSIKVIVLSHYDDFILIKEAMRLGAVDYLRKNEVNENALLAILAGLPEFESIQYRIGVNKAKNIEIRQVWMDALQGRLSGEAEKSLTAQCAPGRYVPVVLQFRSAVSPTLVKRLQVQIDEVRLFDWVQLDERTWLQLVAIDTNSKQAFGNLWMQVLIRMTSQFNEWKKFKQYFALYHDGALGGSRLAMSLAQIGERLDCAFYEGYDRFVSVKNCSPIAKADNSFFAEWTNRLVESSKLEQENLMSMLESFFDEAKVRRFEPDAVRRNCYTLLLQLLDGMNRKPEEYSESGGIEQAGTFSELKSAMLDILSDALRKSKPVRSDIVCAIEYIHKHFAEDISLEKVADISNVSRNHFCMLFKKETQYSFVEYVNRYRIERAKQLLMNSTLRTYEIAYQTGIPDYRYFCRLFRRYTGKQPGDYRYSLVDSKMALKEEDDL